MIYLLFLGVVFELALRDFRFQGTAPVMSSLIEGLRLVLLGTLDAREAVCRTFGYSWRMITSPGVVVCLHCF